MYNGLAVRRNREGVTLGPPGRKPAAMTEHIRMEGLRLGRKPPSDKPTLKLGQFFRVKALPAVPEAVDHLAGVTYDLGRNTEFGTCGPTSLANYVRMVTAKLTGTVREPRWEDIAALYRWQNPGFDPNLPGGGEDTGVDMKTMLADATKHGFGPAAKVLGFAEVDVRDPEEMQTAVAIFGGLLLGLDLDQAQNGQLASGVWDYVADSGTWAATPSWRARTRPTRTRTSSRGRSGSG